MKERLDVFCERLKQRAQQLGLTGATVAERLELTQRTHTYYLSGARQPNLHTMKRALIVAAIAAALLASPAAAEWAIQPDTQMKDLTYVGVRIISTDALMWPDGRSALIIYLAEAHCGPYERRRSAPTTLAGRRPAPRPRTLRLTTPFGGLALALGPPCRRSKARRRVVRYFVASYSECTGSIRCSYGVPGNMT